MEKDARTPKTGCSSAIADMNIPQAIDADSTVRFGEYAFHRQQRLVSKAGWPVPLGGRALDSLTDDLASRDGLPLQLAEHLRGAPLDTGSLEAHDRRGRDLLVKWAPSFSAGGIHTGWILSLVDVTRMRTEQRQRDDAMHFLSHDMRSPQSAILTLVDLLRQDPEAMSPAQFQDRIERHARKALALADV